MYKYLEMDYIDRYDLAKEDRRNRDKSNQHVNDRKIKRKTETGKKGRKKRIKILSENMRKM